MTGRFAEAVTIELACADRRALVALDGDKQAGQFDHYAGLRANFLVHLIATRDRLPQTTILRKASPDIAVLAYATNDPEHLAAAHAWTRSQLA